MATYTKQLLSGSTDGKQILVTGLTSGSATFIHSAPAGTSTLDEVWLYASNEATTSMQLNVLWGGTTEASNSMRTTLLSRSGRTIIVDGSLITNGLIVSAYTPSASVVLIDGFVNRITS